MTGPEDRAGWIAGMRQLLDILEADPELYAPGPGRAWPLTIDIGYMVANEAAQVAAWEQALGVPLEQHLRAGGGEEDTRDGPYFDLDGMLGGLRIRIRARLDQVAERRVLGTRVIEDVEWVRLTAEDPAGAASDDEEPQP